MKKFCQGSIDILSLVGTGLLVLTLVVATTVITHEKSQNIASSAACPCGAVAYRGETCADVCPSSSKTTTTTKLKNCGAVNCTSSQYCCNTGCSNKPCAANNQPETNSLNTTPNPNPTSTPVAPVNNCGSQNCTGNQYCCNSGCSDSPCAANNQAQGATNTCPVNKPAADCSCVNSSWSCPAASQTNATNTNSNTTSAAFCTGANQKTGVSAYTCVISYHGTASTSVSGIQCCTLGTSPNTAASCTLPLPSCPGNATPQCSGTTWSCPAITQICTPGKTKCSNSTTSQTCASTGTYLVSEDCQYGCDSSSGSCKSKPVPQPAVSQVIPAAPTCTGSKPCSDATCSYDSNIGSYDWSCPTANIPAQTASQATGYVPPRAQCGGLLVSGANTCTHCQFGNNGNPLQTLCNPAPPAPHSVAVGKSCSSDNDCQSGTCYAGNSVIGGSPFDSTQTCHAATVAQMNQAVETANTGTLIGGGVVGAAAAAPVVVAAYGAAGNLALAGMGALTAAPAAVQTGLAIGGSVAALSALPVAVATCGINGQNANSPACINMVGGIYSGYLTNPIGSEQALQASAQTIANSIVNPAVNAIASLSPGTIQAGSSMDDIINSLANSSTGNLLFGNPSFDALEAVQPTLANPEGLQSSGQIEQNWLQEVSNNRDPRLITSEEALNNKLDQVANLSFDEATVKVLDKEVIAGRQVLEVELPTGDSILCYRSTGTCTPTLKKLGDWQVIGGFAENGWFIKTNETINLVKPGGNTYAINLVNYLHNNEALFFPELGK